MDEKTLWPQGRFATTNLVVSTTFLQAHPQTVAELLDAQITTNQWITANPAAAQTLISGAIKKLTGSTITAAEIQRAWSEESVTDDPLASSLQTELEPRGVRRPAQDHLADRDLQPDPARPGTGQGRPADVPTS